ncbi:MAG: 16S rRNA (cytosine(1402)-N(4))-methyltransferase RsmH [Bacteroidales bacterium]|nr:16S rRNA (cytosine(1402)-N(4))-methyltransferase RsmH [Bacteroidales bacterium]MBN2761829.1 16S rRNA (cytosine(1402)-N(4))-methyltransferase RsmH [Bacteroidales bacterium]
MTAYHQPVLLNEAIEGLNVQVSGTYVDVTFGGGGHSREILKRLGKHGKLYAFDQDEDTTARIPDDRRIIFTCGNFRFLENYLRFYGVKEVDGILADLGVSSHHFDEPERGFSYRYNVALDMRMNRKGKLTAAGIVAGYSESELEHILSAYGELHNSRKVARSIINARSSRNLDKTGDLITVIQHCIPAGQTNQYLSKVFQAFRIEVNRETENLSDMLEQSSTLLKRGGRLVVISYHSLEDRLVKNYFKSGNIRGITHKDVYGNYSVPFRSLHQKPVVPSEKEIKNNTRARSAKLRVAVKN